MNTNESLLAGQNHIRLMTPLKSSVTDYIESCHMKDGGYFFARVTPSGGQDTFFAVKSLSMLGVKPGRPEETADFFIRDINNGRLAGLSGVFVAVEVLVELGAMTPEIRDYALGVVLEARNRAGGFGAYEDQGVEVESELQLTYQAVKVLKLLGSEVNAQEVSGFVSRVLNPDGGFGRNGLSTLASTFYAAGIYESLGIPSEITSETRKYLHYKREKWQIHFIEDLYRLVGALTALGEKAESPPRIIDFVLACQCTNGGFSRFTEMGIPTLENTFYAVSVLKTLTSFR